MKIGILTQPLLTNYGGLLQNYALQQVLIKRGYDVVTIDWLEYNYYSRSFLFKKWIKTYIMSCFNFILPRWHFMTPREVKQTTEKLETFKNTYIIRTSKIRKKEGLNGVDTREKLNCFIVGSDQCWRPSYNGSFLTSMFLDFLPDNYQGKRIAYAASFGTKEWEFSAEETKKCSLLAQKFDLITTREHAGEFLCKNYLHVDATTVLDPTMLLTANDYMSLLGLTNKKQTEGYLATYILDSNEQIEKTISNVANKLNLNHRLELRAKLWSEHYYKDKFNLSDYVCMSMNEWLEGIYNAEMVVTNSFHGMVFSILFNKPFWIVGNKERGLARFESLLQDLQLTNRLLLVNNFDTVDLQEKIDWSKVNKLVEDKRNYSLNLLTTSIG